MKNTVQFMIRQFSITRFVLTVFAWVIGSLFAAFVVELFSNWTNMETTLHTYRDVLLITGVLLCIGAYENAKGKIQGINEGTFNERETWTNWYKRHQEKIKEHKMEFKEPTESELACPKCGGTHDLLSIT